MLRIHSRAWLLALLSAGLQVAIFPLPNLYVLCWVAVAPLIAALLRAQTPDTLQLKDSPKLIPAGPLQGFLLGYACGAIWYAGTCYWIYGTMRHYGGLSLPAAGFALLLFCLYLGLYHGLFGLLLSVLARRSYRVALMCAPLLWVAVELARTRITGFPWELLGIAQVDNIPLARIADITGVYGLSFEIMLVNTAFAAVLVVPREKRRVLLTAATAAAVVLQAGRLLTPAPLPADRTALLVQQNIPVLDASDWTRDYFESTIQDLVSLSVTPPGNPANVRLIIWPESPAPFYVADQAFQTELDNLAREAHAWVVAGSIGTPSSMHEPEAGRQVFNSAALFSPAGTLAGRYDKVHLVPFGEYVPLKRVFGFAAGLTEAVGEFGRGASRKPLTAGEEKLGVFICYESIFPDEVRQFAANGANVLVNISNDGWYGDSGAYAQHLGQTRMRAIENGRWLLSGANTGVTASIDPYGRVVSRVERKIRTALAVQYAASEGITFYTRHGDWFAYLCAIISAGALLLRFTSRRKAER